MDAETGFMIDGKVYEVPALDSFVIDELRLLYDLTGFVREDFVRTEDETDDEFEERRAGLVRHPGFAETLMVVAYRRGNHTVSLAKARVVIGNTNYAEAIATLAEPEEETPAVPLALTSEPNEASSNDSLENDHSTKQSNGNGGPDLMSGSAEQAGRASNTGTTPSAISSTSAHESLTT